MSEAEENTFEFEDKPENKLKMNNKCCPPPVRGLIFAMLFTTCLYSYVMRVNLSLSMIAMVEKTGSSSHVPECANKNQLEILRQNPNATLPDYGDRFEWDSKLQGYLLGAYFYGYTITCIPGGYFAERFGPVQTIGVSMGISALLTGITPIISRIHWSLVLIVRAIIGLMGGLQFPAVQNVIAHWAPPNEKSKFVFTLLGGTFGTVITWPILAAIIMEWGWDWSFYATAISTLIWTISWYLLATDTPETHKLISGSEKKYILDSLGASVGKKTKAFPPYKKILTSIPVWALIIAQFGNMWGLYLLMTAGPKFMAEVLGFNLKESGILAAIPYLSRMIFGFAFAFIGDYMREKKYMTVSNIRRWFTIFSHILPGLTLLLLLATGCDQFWAVALITLSMGFNGATTVTHLANAQDLAPNFAGTIYGFVNCIGGTTGFITPFFTGLITAKHSGLTEWHLIFVIGAIAYMAAGLIFMIFGSGLEQNWNNTNNQIAKEECEEKQELK